MPCYLRSAAYGRLPTAGCLHPATYALKPVACSLQPSATCYLLPATCYLLPATCYLLAVAFCLDHVPACRASQPFTAVYPFPPAEALLVLASDGVWDTVNPNTVGKLVLSANGPQNAVRSSHTTPHHSDCPSPLNI